MNKVLKISLLLCFISLQFAFAQSETRQVENFSEVAVGGSFDVYLKQGSKAEVKIEAKNAKLEDIVTEVSGNKLSIKLKDNYWGQNGRAGKIWVTYTDLKKITSSGSSDVQAESKIKTDDLRVTLSGSGNVKAEIDVKRLELTISGSADAQFSGKAQEQEVTISGSGELKAVELESEKAEIKISGSGDATIYVKQEIDARTSGSGEIRFKGNPAKQITKSSGSGSIESIR